MNYNWFIFSGFTIASIFFELAIVVSDQSLTMKYMLTGVLIFVYVVVNFSPKDGSGFYNKEGK